MNSLPPSAVRRSLWIGVLAAWLVCPPAHLGAAAGAAPGTIEGVIRDQTGAPVKEAVVYLPEARPVPAPGAPRRAVKDQLNRAFVPLALVVRVGTTVRFPNSDGIHHSVYSFSRAKRFELGLFQGQGAEVRLDRPGEVKVFCSIHRSMGGLIVVVDHPYAAVTDAEGRYRLAGVPPGAHAVRAIHVFARGVTDRVSVGPGPAAADFRLTMAVPRRDLEDPGY